MRVLWDLESARQILDRPVLTVGNFDGVHLGHQAILKETVRLAQKMERSPVVLTFDPHPQKVFKGEDAPPVLTPLSEKIRLLEATEVTVTVVCPFDQGLYRLSAEEFFSTILVTKLGAVHLVEGEDFTFGKGRTGSPRLLRRLGRDHRVGVTIVDSVTLGGEGVSSSRIRALITRGDVSTARSLLGRPYAVVGERVRGRGRGKTLGYPTLNLTPENELLPAVGIYAVQCECNGRVFLGAASLGFNPTFGENRFSFEVHLLDFQGTIGDDRVRVLFHERLRDELKFDTSTDLIDQMESDVAQVRRILHANWPEG